MRGFSATIPLVSTVPALGHDGEMISTSNLAFSLWCAISGLFPCVVSRVCHGKLESDCCMRSVEQGISFFVLFCYDVCGGGVTIGWGQFSRHDWTI
jgi:hypothetical protein